MYDRGQKRVWGSRQRLGEGWLKKHALTTTSQIVGCGASVKARGTVMSEWHLVLRGRVGQNFRGFDRVLAKVIRGKRNKRHLNQKR